jgi:hypothetical protein
LDRTIFIPDEDNPELPAYTEWGYNSFGAFYERDKIGSTNDIVPCKIVYKDGRLDFSLIGRCQRNKTALTFSFPLSEVKAIDDLSILHNFKVNLTENCIVTLEEENSPTTFEVLSGQLHFKRFQLLRVDEKVNRIILSGIFDLKFLKNGRPESISDGRFDMGITDRDFYSQ